MTIVHRTYTEFDLRAITINGLSVKPEAGKIAPIGKFGTGLKYALSVLMRNGCSVTILTPGQRHKLVGRVSSFRGQEFEGLMLLTYRTGPQGPGKAKRTDLPFTTHYGSNWEMWMAFREIESNTRDEGGWTKAFQRAHPAGFKHISEGCAIIIEGEDYEKEFYRSGQTFLNPDGPPQRSMGGVNIYDLPHPDFANSYKYYRGLRAGVMRSGTTEVCSLYIYDVVGECYLTEERQVIDHYWDWKVCSAIATSDDAEFIRSILEAEDDTFEAGLTFHDSMPVSETFMEVAASAKVRQRHYEFIKAKTPKSIEQLDLEDYPTPWTQNGYAILAANDNPVASRPNGMTESDFRAIWADRLTAINTHAPSVFLPAPEAVQEPVGSSDPTGDPGEGSTAPGEAPAVEGEGAEDRVYLTEEVEEQKQCDDPFCPGCYVCMPF